MGSVFRNNGEGTACSLFRFDVGPEEVTEKFPDSGLELTVKPSDLWEGRFSHRMLE